MVYGETGRFRKYKIYCRMINCWGKFIDGKKEKLSALTNCLLYILHEIGVCKCKRIDKVEIILQSTGLNNIWLYQNNEINRKRLIQKVERCYQDNFLQE